jgi:hypothetical protein
VRVCQRCGIHLSNARAKGRVGKSEGESEGESEVVVFGAERAIPWDAAVGERFGFLRKKMKSRQMSRDLLIS